MKPNPSVDPRDASRLSDQCEKILAMLRERPRTSIELAQVALKYTSRITDIRDAGYYIKATRGARGVWTYELITERQLGLFGAA